LQGVRASEEAVIIKESLLSHVLTMCERASSPNREAYIMVTAALIFGSSPHLQLQDPSPRQGKLRFKQFEFIQIATVLRCPSSSHKIFVTQIFCGSPIFKMTGFYVLPHPLLPRSRHMLSSSKIGLPLCYSLFAGSPRWWQRGE
jgi:hypothetical protein